MFSSSASRSIASSRVSRTIAGMRLPADRLRGPPAPLAHDQFVLVAVELAVRRSAGGSRPPGSRSSAPPAPPRRRPAGAASGWARSRRPGSRRTAHRAPGASSGSPARGPVAAGGTASDGVGAAPTGCSCCRLGRCAVASGSRRGRGRDQRPRPRPRPPRGRFFMPRLPAPRPHYALPAHRLLDATLGDLLGGLEVARGAPRTGIVGHHRLAVARRLGDPHVARDDRLQNLVAEVVPDVLLDRVRQPGTPVVHGQQDRGDLERRVEVLPYQVDVVDQLVSPSSA